MFRYNAANIVLTITGLLYEACKPAAVLGFIAFLIWGQQIAFQVAFWVFGLYLGLAAVLALAGLGFTACSTYLRKRPKSY